MTEMTQHVTVPMTAALKAALKEKATADNRPLAEYIRNLLINDLMRAAAA